MCGVFGFVTDGRHRYPPALLEKAVMGLARAAECRGKDSSGVVVRQAGRGLDVFKGNTRITELCEVPAVATAIRGAITEAATSGGRPTAMMGHSRLVTNGSQLQDENNQPVVRDGIVGIHNGIITNDEALWAQHPELTRRYEIDTEVWLALIDLALRQGHRIDEAIATASHEIEGTYSVAMLFQGLPKLALATNNGSLYTLTDDQGFVAFASEEEPLKVMRTTLSKVLGARSRLAQVAPHSSVIVSLDPFAVEVRSTREIPGLVVPPVQFGGLDGPPIVPMPPISVSEIDGRRPRQELVLDTAILAQAPAAAGESRLLEFYPDRIAQLRRCTRCVLPETFPFISFDEQGVCSYCDGYRLRNQPKPFEELLALVEPYRSKDGTPDCIVPFSGGRDSTYALHVIKTKLGLNPIAFTYDWGMVTDLGRRNIARVCGRLGVENIIVAADIYRKRDNIKRNVVAWLRRPHLGMVPLFMAGDKYFYYYASKVGRQTGIKLNIWGVNPLENTDFKVGFMGVPPDFAKKRIYSLSLSRQLTLFGSVASQFAANPSYLNRSLLDSVGSFISRSIMPRTNYYHLFDYVRWDEAEIEKILFGEYDWERACDTQTTWRIGDGTAAFYNYIYCTVAGFSEHDTFRSNQIREGQMSREEALRLVERDNQPRYPTIKWYLEVLGLNFESTIRRVNAMPKLYR